MSGPVKRAARVADQVREQLATALVREMTDPHLAACVVTRVEMTDDLQNARVYVRTTAPDSEAERRSLTRALQRASGALRKLVGQRLGLRRTPELRFFYDEGQDASGRVQELLAEIERERRGQGE